jgi:hypothetical protein
MPRGTGFYDKLRGELAARGCRVSPTRSCVSDPAKLAGWIEARLPVRRGYLTASAARARVARYHRQGYPNARREYVKGAGFVVHKGTKPRRR